MRRQTTRWLALIALLFTAAAEASALRGQNHVSIDGRRVAFAQAGKGRVTVIFESGLGDGAAPWAYVFNDVSRFTRAFAYDRPGYGGSGRTKSARDGATIVKELRALLQRRKLEPPYVLVGHSLGGQFVELFARLHPEEVAAVVLVESRPSSFTARCKSAGLDRCQPPPLLVKVMPRAARTEIAAAEQTEKQLAAAPKLRRDLPLFVLTSGHNTGASAEMRKLWLEGQKQLAAMSEASRHVVVEKSGHYIQREQPKEVVAAIREAVAQTGSSVPDAKR